MEEFLRILLSVEWNKVDIFALTQANLKPNYDREKKEVVKSDTPGDAISFYFFKDFLTN